MKQEDCMTTSVFGSEEMLKSSPVDKIPQHPTTPEIAYRMVKDETFAQTQPRLNLATFVTTYMDVGSIPAPGGFHMLWGGKPQALQLRVLEPALLNERRH